MSDAATPRAEKTARYGAKRPKVPPFARFKGTSAWTKYPVRAREYAKFRAAERQAARETTPG